MHLFDAAVVDYFRFLPVVLVNTVLSAVLYIFFYNMEFIPSNKFL